MRNLNNYDIKIDYELLSKFPGDFVLKNFFFPLEEEEDKITVLMYDPENLDKLSIIENFAQKNVETIKTEKNEIEKLLKRTDIFTRVLKEKTQASFLKKDDEDKNFEDSLSIEKITEDDDSIIKLLNNILFTAVNKKASDIHIEVMDNKVLVKFRIDGILTQIMEPLGKDFQMPLVTRLKVISELDIAERRVPQDGRFSLNIRSKRIDFRVSLMPGVFGENIVIRILDREMITENIGELRLDILGFSDYLLNDIRFHIRQPYGMFLVTGPTGSGKTTTLYAALNEIKSPEDKIITIEDPVEYRIDNIVQIPVNDKKGLTFARGLRSILRHDPDKLMVGEIRDSETAQIAIQSALTGHLVFTTVHANNVFDVLGRFIHMGVDAYSFISSLNCIIAQRLVRILCPDCKELYSLAEDAYPSNRIKRGYFKEPIYKSKGCKGCSFTGYKGRTAIGETLELQDEIREMILEKKPLSEVKHRARELGMIPMRKNALIKVSEGITSIKEINRVTLKEWIE
jgi:type IV pilus assembly protein PilB